MYCSVPDIVNALTEPVVVQLTSTTGSGTYDEELLTDLIESASEQIDDYLRGRYDLPLQNQHAILMAICIEFVRYELYKRRSSATELIHLQYTDSILKLTQIQRGLVKLDEGTSVASPIIFKVSSSKPVFTDDLIDNY
jgi:phage gp36-like protein